MASPPFWIISKWVRYSVGREFLSSTTLAGKLDCLITNSDSLILVHVVDLTRALNVMAVLEAGR